MSKKRTLYQMFQDTTALHGDRHAAGFKIGKAAETTYYSYTELDRKVRAFRRGLDALGLVHGDRIAILSENRVEWAITDLAAQSLGLVTVAPYVSLPAEQVAYIVRDSEAKAIVVSDTKQLAKVRDF